MIARRTAIPKALVHRPSFSDVLPTGRSRTSETEFRVGVRWPAQHEFYSPASRGSHDSLLVAETMRQSAIYLAHTEFGVPLGHHFVMWGLRYLINPRQLVIQPDDAVDVQVRCSEIRRTGSRFGGMHCELTINRGSGTVAVGGGRITCTTPAVYRRLRGERPSTADTLPAAAPPVPARTVGRASEDDVFLSPTPDPLRWRLRVNPAHPTLFARANDHVPGMMLLEAARQASHAAVGADDWVVLSSSIEFYRYAELDAECRLEATPAVWSGSLASVAVTAFQGDAAVFRATFDGLAVHRG